MIISDIDELKKHLGRAINNSTTLDFIQSYIQLAQENFILPAIGEELLTELDTQYNASPQTLTDANKKLLEKLQRALAFYAYVKYSPFSLGNDGDNGLQEQGTQNTKPVRIGVLDKRQREAASNAAESLETALVFLHKNKGNYPTWTASDAYKQAASLFVFSGTELTQYVPQAGNSYRLFLSMVPFLQIAEKDHIKPLIGQAQFDDLKLKRQQTTPLQPVDIRLLEAVGKATATKAYALALYWLNVQPLGNGALRILSDFDGIYNSKAVDAQILLQTKQLANGEADSALNGLKSYLTEFADQYPLYKNSDRFGAKGPNEFPNNSTYKGIFRMR